MADSQQLSFHVAVGNGIVLDMLFIPGGEFVMGSPDGEPGRTRDEGPQHRVRIPPFFLGKYPVTQSQWETVMGTNPSYFKGGNHPVENVSWQDAIAFCRRFAEMHERPYRLPSEAEWEYACRAGTASPFAFGDRLTTATANVYLGEFRGGTTPVGRYPANNFGVHDMHGNVREWCQDLWHTDYQGAPTDGSAWEKGSYSHDRILRGGSWFLEPQSCRSATRVSSQPHYSCYYFGFRVALTP